MDESEIIQPVGWKKPRGYANGILAPSGARALFVAGQIAWDAEERIVGGADFVAQFRQALSNVVHVLARAGGKGRDLTRVTIYVVDAKAYTAGTKEIGAIWRELVGSWYPAMTLIVVAGLLEQGALVEIEATAMIPKDAHPPA